MKTLFFSDNYIKALARSYTVPCEFWQKDDEVFYTKNLLPPFTKFMKDLLPKLKKCDSRVNDNLGEILVTCKTREKYTLPADTETEIGAIIGHNKAMKGQPFAGLLFGFTPKKIILAGGIFGLSGENAAQLHEYLEKRKEQYSLLIENEDFADSFGEGGFCYTPNQFVCTPHPIKVYKNFVGCTGELPARFITDDILPDIIIAHYKGIKAMNRFLLRALRPIRHELKISV